LDPSRSISYITPSRNVEFLGWLMGSQMNNASCDEAAVFNNLNAIELEVKTGRGLTRDEGICFTFSDEFTTICVESSRGHGSSHDDDFKKETAF
jgi:hypothetical protein